MKFTPNLTRREFKYGLIAMTLALLVLPGLLELIPGLSAPRLNFLSYLIAAVTAVCCLRGFLGRNLQVALDHPFPTLYYAALGYLAHLALGEVVAFATFLMDPGFISPNNQNILTQLRQELWLMIAATVVLAPIAEECFFRGLLFRGIYDRSPAAAWTASVGLFALAHVAGYIGTASPLALVLSFVQYLPAGIILCFTYQRTGGIIAPILTHAIVNLMAVYTATR